MSTDVRTRGTWPGPIVLRRGFALGHARPWNDQDRNTAAIRLIRGSDGFVETCVNWLADQGVTLTRSPALMDRQTGLWRRAGFVDHLDLLVYERSVGAYRVTSNAEVHHETDPDVAIMAEIDDAAFEPLWRVGRLGLNDAMGATPISAVLTVGPKQRPVGFVIVGVSTEVAYLQRLAVFPGHQGQGLGRSLVRASLRWAARSGARTMLLNTQPENRRSAALYVDEGFRLLDTRLRVLAWTREGESAQ